MLKGRISFSGVVNVQQKYTGTIYRLGASFVKILRKLGRDVQRPGCIELDCMFLRLYISHQQVYEVSTRITGKPSLRKT
jgi:hypothetical protein